NFGVWPPNFTISYEHSTSAPGANPPSGPRATSAAPTSVVVQICARRINADRSWGVSNFSGVFAGDAASAQPAITLATSAPHAIGVARAIERKTLQTPSHAAE